MWPKVSVSLIKSIFVYTASKSIWKIFPLNCCPNWLPPFLRGYNFQKLLFFLYKQKCLLFYQGDGYLWPHCCMNNLYISHRSLYAPKNTAFEQSAASLSVCLESFPDLIPFVILWHAGWTLEKLSCMNMNYNYPTTIFRSIFAQMYKIFKIKMKNCR